MPESLLLCLSPAEAASAASASAAGAIRVPAAVAGAVQQLLSALAAAGERADPEVVCTGLAVGLPGGEAIFAPDAVDALLAGLPRLRPLPDGLVAKVLPGPQRTVLAGVPAAVDLVGRYGLDSAWVDPLDTTSRLAVAAGLEALAEAGLPLVASRSGPGGRALPAALRAGTGVVFASALPGLVRLLMSGGEARALELAEGHLAFSALIDAGGPITSVNAGKSSTAMALTIAADWIRLGRAERVVVLGADDPTEEALLEIVGAGLLGGGRFISGGASGFVLESAASAAARGRRPWARLVDSRALRVARPSGDPDTEQRGALLASLHIDPRSPEVDLEVSDGLSGQGDALGAGLDDALAVAVAHRGIRPGPEAARWTGRRVIRVAMGSGASVVLLAWERAGIERADAGKAAAWLAATTGFARPTLRVVQGTLVAVDETAMGTPSAASAPPPAPPVSGRRIAPPELSEVSEDAATAGPPDTIHLHRARSATPDAPRAELVARATRRLFDDLENLVVPRVGQLPPGTQPGALHGKRLSADLGLSPVEQGEIADAFLARYPLDIDLDELLSGDPTVGRLAEILADEALAIWRERPEVPDAIRKLFALPEDAEVIESEASEGMGTEMPLLRVRAAHHAYSGGAAELTTDPALVSDIIVEIVAAHAGYRPDELGPSLELEGDLGLDAAAQEHILGELRARFRLDTVVRLTEHPTIAAVSRWVLGQLGPSAVPVAEAEEQEALPPGVPDAAVHARTTRQPKGARPDLPPSVRMRRPVRVPRPLVAYGSMRGRGVQVLGAGPLAIAVRAAVIARGARLEAPYDAVIDASDAVMEGFESALALAATPPRDWVCLTRLGATTEDRVGATRGGARSGLARGLGREWTGCAARAVDIDPEISNEEAAELACEELASGDSAAEVFRSARGREIVTLRIEDFPPPSPALRRPTVVIAGGTRGIGARAGLELARRWAARLIVLGRTPPSRRPYDEAAARAAVERALRARGRRPSESRVERGLEPYRLAEEARLNLLKMREAGAEVHYFKVDLGDAEAVAAILAEVGRSFGRIDGAVLATGRHEPRPLTEKTATAFRAGYEGRALGGLAIADALGPEAWLVSMGSLVGRFGAAGLAEICAAQAASAGLCLARPRSLHLCWPGWAEAGEVIGDNTTADPLPIEGGLALLADLISAGVSGELVISGRLGASTLIPEHPLLKGMDVEGDAVQAWCTLSVGEDPWLSDYVIDGVARLPVSVGLELLAAAARVAEPAWPFGGVRQLRALAPLEIAASEQVQVLVRAEPLGDGTVRCVLSSDRVGRGGRAQRTDHLEGTVQMGVPAEISVLPPAFFPEEAIDRSQVYRRTFQGSTFQVLREIGAVAIEGLLGDAVVETALLSDGLVSAPLAFEAAFQGAALHRMAIENVLSLPESVDGAWLVRQPEEGGRLELMVRRMGDAYDIDLDGADGAVLRVRGLRLTDHAPLAPDSRLPEPEGGWPSAVVGFSLSQAGG